MLLNNFKDFTKDEEEYKHIFEKMVVFNYDYGTNILNKILVSLLYKHLNFEFKDTKMFDIAKTDIDKLNQNN